MLVHLQAGKAYQRRWFELQPDVLMYAKDPKDLVKGAGGRITGQVETFSIEQLKSVRRVDGDKLEVRAMILHMTIYYHFP